MRNSKDKINIDKNLLEKLYKKYKSCRKIAKKLGTSKNTIRRRLHKYKIKINKQPDYSSLFSKSELAALYKKYKTIKAVSKHIGCSHNTVKKLLQQYDINYNTSARKDFFNERFFSKHTSANRQDRIKTLYWLGFIAADGCVLKNRNMLSINLSTKDQTQLEQLKLDINSTAKLYTFENKQSKYNSKWNNSRVCSIHLQSEILINDLNAFGITNNKTHSLNFPNIILNHPEIYAFCLGYFDGDGCAYITRKGQLFFDLCGTESFLNTFKKIIIDNCSMPEKQSNKLQHGTNIYHLRFNGNNVCSKIFRWMYQGVIHNNDFCMARKYKIIKPYLTL